LRVEEGDYRLWIEFHNLAKNRKEIYFINERKKGHEKIGHKSQSQQIKMRKSFVMRIELRMWIKKLQGLIDFCWTEFYAFCFRSFPIEKFRNILRHIFYCLKDKHRVESAKAKRL
jgi:hypothetical protein